LNKLKLYGNLTDAIQKKLGTDKFCNEQLSEWFGRVTPKQAQAIVDVIADRFASIFLNHQKEI